MKMILLLFCFLLSMDGLAQETSSRIIDKATPVDTARFKVTYSLKYKFHPDIRDYYDDDKFLFSIHNKILFLFSVIVYKK